jgi:hypothetical protein
LQNFTAGDLNLNKYVGNVGIGTNTPNATLDVEGTVVIGAGGKVFSEIREITGTLTTGGGYTFAYPSGYSINNIRILSLEINYWGDMWIGIGGTESISTGIPKVFYLLTSTQIFIYYPNNIYFQNRAFRMMVMKVQ